MRRRIPLISLELKPIYVVVKTTAMKVHERIIKLNTIEKKENIVTKLIM